MFIVAGTKGITSTVGNGDFYCPECAQKTAYLHKQVHKAATFFFIPLANLDLLGEYVECQDCLSTYKMDILDYDPENEQRVFQAEHDRAIKRVMTMMMLEDGRIDNGELRLIREIYEKILGQKVTKDEIIHEINECREKPESLNEFLTAVAPNLNEFGKELLIKVAYWVSLADGEYGKSEKRLLKQISKALDLSSAHLNGIISQLNEEMDELEKQIQS